MASPEEIIMPGASWQGIGALLGALGLGGLLTALVQRPSRRSVEAAAGRDEATGEAAVIASIATAFTGTTGALREEIERMQAMLDDMRRRVTEAETQAVSQARVITEQAAVIIDLKAQLEISHADVIRLRSERDSRGERIAQLEGDVRQLNAVIDARDRVGQ
jgi:hypothetical protein